MKRKTAVIIIAAIIVICVGTALYVHHKNMEHQAVSNVTAIIHFVPTAAQASEPHEQGTCWTGSIAAPYRTDAWRCMVGNEIADPCFYITNSNTLLCSPTGNTDDNFLLILTQPLPTPVTSTTPAPKNWAWKIALSDGTICTPFTGTGTLTADNQKGYYGCDDGSTLLGYLNDSSPLWTVTKATLSAPNPTTNLPSVISSKIVSVKTVWQ